MGSGSNPAEEMLGGLGDMGDMGGESEESSGGPIVWKLLILALIPLAGLVAAIAHKKPIYLACGAVPILIFAFYLIDGGGNGGGNGGGMGGGGMFKVMGIGAYLCIIAGIGMLCTASKAESVAMATEGGGGGMDYGGDSGGGDSGGGDSGGGDSGGGDSGGEGDSA